MNNEQEGTITDIGWRTTRVQTGSNSTFIIPNKTITNGIVLNFDMPQPRVGVGLPIVVGLDADLAQVERICLDAANETEGLAEGSKAVFVLDPGMTANHLQCKVAFQVPRQTAAGLIQAAMLKKILERFRAENIPMPERPSR